MLFHTQPMSDAVGEIGTVAFFFDHGTSGVIDAAGRHARMDRSQRGAVCRKHRIVDLIMFVRRLSDNESPGDIRAIAMVSGAPVEQQEFPVLDLPVRNFRMGIC